MFTRMVLPLLGGSAAVWTTCMLFFQAALLLGYGYAHGATRRLGFGGQLVLHLPLLVLAALFLPVRVARGWVPPGGEMPIPWLLGLLAVSIGIPFVMLSTTAPLLQRWFARGGHPGSENPYFLYAASNAGSILALLSYPVLVEPRLTLRQQSLAWSAGYGILVLAVALCALAVWKGGGGPPAEASRKPAEPVTLGTRLRWVVLALVPSSLLLGVTSYISTDIAAVPFLWVVPLALYLLTFVLVFARRTWLPHRWMIRLQPFVLIPLIFIWFWGIGSAAPVLLLLHLAAFFVTAMVCHGELARLRPAPEHLTEFYLWLSVGGVLGGLFNAIAAPLIFDGVVEYPLAILAACALRPALRPSAERPRDRVIDALSILLPALLMVGVARMAGEMQGTAGAPPFHAIVLVSVTTACVAALCYRVSDRPALFALSLGGVLAASWGFGARRTPLLHAERDFYGVHRVRAPGGGRYHTLYHGTTLHGAQRTSTEDRRDPLTYYAREGPLGSAFDSLPRQGPRRAAIVGLGAGAISAYARAGDQWTFFELDPAVERIARDTSYFTYLSGAPEPIGVVLGDARLSLGRVPDGSYDLVILDAFSSDAIPVHLLTREAVALYRSKLAPGGVILLHLSNRHLRLEPVVSRIAADLGLAGRISFGQMTPAQHAEYKIPSLWAVLVREERDLGGLAHDTRWRPLPPGNGRTWTDDYSDVWSVLGK